MPLVFYAFFDHRFAIPQMLVFSNSLSLRSTPLLIRDTAWYNLGLNLLNIFLNSISGTSGILYMFMTSPSKSALQYKWFV